MNDSENLNQQGTPDTEPAVDPSILQPEAHELLNPVQPASLYGQQEDEQTSSISYSTQADFQPTNAPNSPPPAPYSQQQGYPQQPPAPYSQQQGYPQQPPAPYSQQQGYPQQPPAPYGQQQGYPQQPPAPYGQQQYNPYSQTYNKASYNPNLPYTTATPPGDGAATASLVCGIIGICLAFFGFILGIVAIVQGNSAKKQGFVGGKATAGIVLGIIALVGWLLVIITVVGSCSAYSMYRYW